MHYLRQVMRTNRNLVEHPPGVVNYKYLAICVISAMVMRKRIHGNWVINN